MYNKKIFYPFGKTHVYKTHVFNDGNFLHHCSYNSVTKHMSLMMRISCTVASTIKKG